MNEQKKFSVYVAWLPVGSWGFMYENETMPINGACTLLQTLENIEKGNKKMKTH